MPLYTYIHPKTGEIFEDFRIMAKSDEPFIASDGTECPRDKTPIWEGNINVKEGVSRAEQKEMDHTKKVKDPERARKHRRELFGGDATSITKSKYYHKEKKIKAQGSSNDIDKKDFIQAAAKNPKAVEAAIKATKKI